MSKQPKKQRSAVGPPPQSDHTERQVVQQPPPPPQCYPCPICGGLVTEEHGQFRCRQCGQIVESCCEGAPPAY
jgi:hypothetical protein